MYPFRLPNSIKFSPAEPRYMHKSCRGGAASKASREMLRVRHVAL